MKQAERIWWFLERGAVPNVSGESGLKGLDGIPRSTRRKQFWEILKLCHFHAAVFSAYPTARHACTRIFRTFRQGVLPNSLSF